tara:strand:- start:468 stop:680 length:213 start_codon:yes stop_codon:yes gene_type:complete
METVNPGKVGDDSYETAKFSDLNTGELFWLNTDRSDDNHAHRKLDDYEALNIKLQQVSKFNRHQNVFYKM